MQRRILIAEDSPTQAERVRLLLEDAGYHIEVVPNGREGLQRVHEKPPDLIISDVMMPEMDGYTFCRAIKANETTKRIPFVLLTDRKGALDIIKGLERGADNFITKPFEDGILLERIHRIFAHLELRKKAHLEMEVSIRVGRREIVVSPDKQQIIELLFSTFEDLSRMNTQLEESQRMVEDYARNLKERVEERTQTLQVEIAERKRAEEYLRQSNETLHALIHSSPMGITVLDPDGNVKMWNPAAERIFGWSEQDVLGRPLPTVPPEKREEHRALRERVLRGEVSSGVEIRHQKKDGSLIDISLSTAPLHDAKGDICGIMGIMADITGRKQLEEQLRQAQKMEAVGQLTGGIAHDFNNLLTIVNGYSEMLLQALPAGDPQRDNAAQIKEAGERAVSLTRQLLAFSRKQMLEPKVLDLNAVVANTERMLTRMIGEDVKLVASLMPRLGRVKADPGQIEQVIMNLAVNARDAMPQGGRLTIATANVELDENFTRRHAVVKPGPYVMLAVSDTGCGMDAETQKRIFEPFFTTKERGKGTGLGLSTVYGIVKQSGGSIWVYSEIGRGTTFKVYLPRVEEQPDAVLPATERTASLQGTGTILLVEDDEPLRKLTQAILKKSGYAVLSAGHSDEAFKVGAEHNGPIHLLLSDVVMPGMSGHDLAERMKSAHPDMKVLYLSGYTNDTVVRHGVLDRSMAFLQKPFTARGLLSKVREVLDAPARGEYGGSGTQPVTR